ncbi:MAG: hypothetical protein ACYC3Q_02040 [Gemmatimonadaceae bacterium]
MRHAALPLGLALGALAGWWMGHLFFGILIGLIFGLLGSDLATRGRGGPRRA